MFFGVAFIFHDCLRHESSVENQLPEGNFIQDITPKQTQAESEDVFQIVIIFTHDQQTCNRWLGGPECPKLCIRPSCSDLACEDTGYFIYPPLSLLVSDTRYE